MYTSGWPNDQNRCCHSVALPPPAGSKNRPPSCRSTRSITSADVRIGYAPMIRTLVMRTIHVNIGARPMDHPRAPHEQDRDGEVDRADDRPRARDREPEDVPVHAAAHRVGGLGQRRVREPPGVRRASGDEAQVQQDAAEQREPERQRVEARERDVIGADLQGHDVVREADEQRDRDEEDHRDPVHREDLVVRARIEDVLARRRELHAEQQRLEPADGQERDAQEHVEDADVLVIHRPEDARGREGPGPAHERGRGHFRLSRYATTASRSDAESGTFGMSAPGL